MDKSVISTNITLYFQDYFFVHFLLKTTTNSIVYFENKILQVFLFRYG